MKEMIQNYNEFLGKVCNNSSREIVDDKIFWNSLVFNKMKMTGIKGEVGALFSVEVLKGFETKNGEPFCIDFAVTGIVNKDNTTFITKLLAV